jgi:hypothetical protein
MPMPMPIRIRAKSIRGPRYRVLGVGETGVRDISACLLSDRPGGPGEQCRAPGENAR